MIKLYELLKEQVGQPKAIILAGAPGAGWFAVWFHASIPVQ